MFEHLAMWTWPDSTWKEDPQRLVDRLHAAHVDMIVPYACARAMGEKRQQFDDKLRAITEAGHQRGLTTHACFDELNAYPDMPVYDLRQVREDGSETGSLCPANPRVVEFVLHELTRVLTEFDYDGINLEDGYIWAANTIYDPAHTPGEEYRTIPVCHCDYCQQHAPLGKPEWAHWRQERLTDLIAAEGQLIRQLRPGLPFSVAARMPYDVTFYAPYEAEVPYYSGWKHCQSRDGYGADWAEWLRRGHIDFACPMSYFHSTRLVELELRECQKEIPNARETIWMGLGLGDCTAEYIGSCGGEVEHPGPDADPSLRNDGPSLARLLDHQVAQGQRKVILFCYQFLQDEHIPVLANYR
jgi:hypothetical protein